MSDMTGGPLQIEVHNKHKLSDYEVFKVNVLKSYDNSNRTVTNEMYEEAYEIFKVAFTFFGKKVKDPTPVVRLKTIKQVARYLYIEAGNGLTEDEILEALEKDLN